MRPAVIASAIAINSAVFGFAHGAEVSEQGAKKLQGDINDVLSHDLAKSGFVSVKAAKDAYDITVNWSRFFDKFNSSEFSLSGMQPVILKAAPLASGLWDLTSGGNMDVTAETKLPAQPASTIHYKIGSYDYKGTFDPKIQYIRSGEMTAKDFSLFSTQGPQKVQASISAMDVSIGVTDSTAKAGTVDLVETGTLSGFKESLISTEPAMAFQIGVDSIALKASATRIEMKQIRDLVHFVFQHAKAKDLSPKGRERFVELIRGAMPLFGRIDEDVTGNNIQLVTDKGNVGIKKVNYTFGLDGVSKASAVNIGFNVQDISLDPTMLPDPYKPLLPSVVDLKVRVPGLDFEDLADELLKTDFKKKPSPEQSERLAHAILPDGTIITESSLTAKSGSYDIDITMKTKTDVKDAKHPQIDATILARDFDKSIAAVQDLAKAEPKLNTASFGMMMAKGMAKTDPDGRMRWDITVTEDDNITVNGQVFKNPMAAKQQAPEVQVPDDSDGSDETQPNDAPSMPDTQPDQAPQDAPVK